MATKKEVAALVYTEDDFYKSSFCNWASVAEVPKEAELLYVSTSGSKYWILYGYELYRESDHWHADVNGCAWFLDGKIYSKTGKKVLGCAELSSFKVKYDENLDVKVLSENAKNSLAKVLARTARDCDQAQLIEILGDALKGVLDHPPTLKWAADQHVRGDDWSKIYLSGDRVYQVNYDPLNAGCVRSAPMLEALCFINLYGWQEDHPYLTSIVSCTLEEEELY